MLIYELYDILVLKANYLAIVGYWLRFYAVLDT